jgi:Na+/phosphate symporter
MSLFDVLIPLIPGVLLAAFPNILTPKTASAEEAVRKKSKLRKIGYVLIGVAALYFCLTLMRA